MLRRIAHAESAIVPGAGHTSNMENPAVFNELVAEFLERVTGSAISP
jgi:pimeloyl-ACP methyl ester carboxylesterase